MNDFRKAAEQAYTVSTFDYPSAPVGSRDWCLFWKGWMACMNSFCLTDALATRRDRDEWRNHADALAQQTFIAEQKLSAAEQQRDSWKAKAEANERDAGRWRQFMSSVSYWREPLVNAATGEEVGDECLYRISWRGRPFATLENSVDAARSAEKEKE